MCRHALSNTARASNESRSTTNPRHLACRAEAVPTLLRPPQTNSDATRAHLQLSARRRDDVSRTSDFAGSTLALCKKRGFRRAPHQTRSQFFAIFSIPYRYLTATPAARRSNCPKMEQEHRAGNGSTLGVTVPLGAQIHRCQSRVLPSIDRTCARMAASGASLLAI